MKSVVWFLVASAMAVVFALSGWTSTFAQQADLGAAYRYEQDTLQTALRSIRAQLDELESVPQKVRQVFKRARDEGQAFVDAASAGNDREARRHYRSATRDLARISRWLVDQDGEAEAQQDEHQLRVRMKRLSIRLTKLSRQGDALELSPDLAAIQTAVQAAKAALAAHDVEASKAALKDLRAALEVLEDLVIAELDARAEAEVQP